MSKKPPSQPPPKKEELSTATIWTGTLILVVIILGGSYYISKTMRPSPVYQAPATQPQKISPETVEESIPEEVPAAPLVDTDVAKERSPVPVPADTPAEPAPDGPVTLDLGNLAGTLEATIPVLWPENNRLPLDYTCYRQNQNFPVNWQKAPPETKEFVLLMEKTEGGAAPHLYWSVYNIPESMSSLPKGLGKGPHLESGLMYGENDHGVSQYTGPCDPKGEAQYRVRLLALDKAFDLEPGLERDDLIRAINGHIIDMAEIDLIHYLRRR